MPPATTSAAIAIATPTSVRLRRFTAAIGAEAKAPLTMSGFSRSSAISFAVWGRLSRSFSRHNITKRASGAGTSVRRPGIGGGVAVSCAASSACGVLLLKGT